MPVPGAVIRLYAIICMASTASWTRLRVRQLVVSSHRIFVDEYQRLQSGLPVTGRSGIMFGPHTFRHSYATEMLCRNVPVEVVQHLLGHASIATTSDAYAHLKVEDTRRALVAAGWLADRDGSW